MVVVDHLVIGAGVVGLAIARQLSSRSGTTTLVVDKNEKLGMETSSRNSEVIHAGIYYPKDSLRTKLCIEGKNALYDYCNRRNVPFGKVGKWVVAQNDEQAEYLHRLAKHCVDLDVPVEIIGKTQAQGIEPFVRTHQVLVSPTTGILDSHAYMLALHQDLEDNGADFAPNTEVIAISTGQQKYKQEKDGNSTTSDGYRVLVSTGDSDTPFMAIKASVVVNAAGLWADRIANMLVPEHHEWRTKYKLHFAKGRYYMYTGGTDGSAKIKVNRLIYPVPDKQITSLGTHLTIDMGGAIRFGPDLEWITSNTNYAADSASSIDDAVSAISEYLPGISAEDLSPGYTGIRPKLQPPGGAFRDFVIKEEADTGFPGFVNLLGIESPGLTASLAIARMVNSLVY
ncbi:hypothetical protein GGI25_003222 [Coemansia spiralis]|uniref:L-2-hydroxyglutarate dehydrogenase, mitochondrial n=2 Tax=Coemansia TaxID=4863 RepID=A0A9W8G950_9FUNG|nr:FAD dependent oxidoreductase [Coemansia spiralis]KAJ1991862.1 hypothetical protein EDC05_003217 [Coemansia umbellata]KAJ2677467.1 hypothetical protein GGI25_003222 [Coemansia spiralis]